MWLLVLKLCALATFLGGPLGGAALLAMNERRLGRAQAAVVTALAGAVGTALLFAMSLALPDNVPGAPLAIVWVLVMRGIAVKRQGAIVEAHVRAGGKKGSGWAAAGIGVACLVIALVPLFAILFVAELAKGIQ